MPLSPRGAGLVQGSTGRALTPPLCACCPGLGVSTSTFPAPEAPAGSVLGAGCALSPPQPRTGTHGAPAARGLHGGNRDTGGSGERGRAGRHRLPAGRVPRGGAGTCGAGLAPGPGSPADPRRRRLDPSGTAVAPAAMGRRGFCPAQLCLLLLLLQVRDGTLGPCPGRWDSSWDRGILPGTVGPCPVLTPLSGQASPRLCEQAAPCQPSFTTETFALTMPQDSVAAGQKLGQGEVGTVGTGWVCGTRVAVGMGWVLGDGVAMGTEPRPWEWGGHGDWLCVGTGWPWGQSQGYRDRQGAWHWSHQWGTKPWPCVHMVLGWQ